MAVKTCRLCGRPLSRIRVGGDEEFCSREHRNQFRLRSSMGRLLEANKVASVMRRRETLRQIPVTQLLRSTEMETRPGTAVAPFRTDRVPEAVITARAVHFHADVGRKDEFSSLSPRDIGPHEARSPELLGDRLFRPVGHMPTPAHDMATKSVTVPRAGMTRIQIARVGPVAQTRESRLLLHTGEQPRFERYVTFHPTKDASRTEFHLNLIPRANAWSGKMRTCAARSPSWKLRFPNHTVELEVRLPGLSNPLPAPRAPQVQPVAQLREPFWRTETQLPLRPITAQCGQRFSKIEFVQPTVRLNGIGVGMYRPMPEARLDGFLSGASLIEDDFSNGADLWAGDTAEWNLDAAGVRPAGLALFKPSLGMGDYEFEFLARIESKAVTCVLRALNASNYHKITIRRSTSGEHELRRSVMIGSVEEGVAIVPITGLPAKQSAFTVKARARRNDFSILVEGQTVARWTDGRLLVGGAGFTAGRGERARIYCVRLTLFETAKTPVAPIRRLRSLS